MKKNIFLLIFAFALLLASCAQKSSIETDQSINPVIGDISYKEKFNKNPDIRTDENLRIRTHLEYVERMLRESDVQHVTTALQLKRREMLDLLHEYRTSGRFPKNYDYPGERKPCFIDKDGNICAVGYLIEQTSGRKVAEEINSVFKYSRIFDMNLPVLANWIAKSGLTLKECAMIQPAYSDPKPEDYIEPSYGVTSSLLGGANLSLMTINAIHLSKPVKSKAVPVIGLITGTAQFAIGLNNIPKETMSPRGAVTHEAKKRLSFINIAVGTSTMILSAYNLLTNSEPKKNKTAGITVYSFPVKGKAPEVGLSYRRRL